MKKFKLIIFDFDGVLVDTFKFGLKLERLLNPDISEEKYRAYYNGNYFETRDKKDVKKINSKQAHFNLIKDVKIKEKTKILLKTLSRKYPLVINSGSPEKSIKYILEKNQVLKYFNEIFGCETSKDKVEKFKLFCKNHELDPKEVLLITDTLGDILEAREAGIEAIAVSNKMSFSKRKSLEKGNPLALVENLGEIENYLLK